MKEISIAIDDKDEVTFKTKGFEDPIEIMQMLNHANNQILASLKVRNSGVIKPNPDLINQAFSKDNTNRLRNIK